jgi:hypothetical protein
MSASTISRIRVDVKRRLHIHAKKNAICGSACGVIVGVGEPVEGAIRGALGARPCPRVSSRGFYPRFNGLPIVSFRGWPKQHDRCDATRIGPGKDFKNRRSLDPVASIPPQVGRRVRISDATTGDFSLFPALLVCSRGVDSDFPGPLPPTAERVHGQSRACARSLCEGRFGARCIIWR